MLLVGLAGIKKDGNYEKIKVDEEGNVMVKLAGGTDTSDATATADDILSTKTAYAKGEKLTGSMANNGALNYTPSTSSQTIPAGYTSGGTVGAVTSSIDANIVAENIKKDVSILGVTGSYEGSGGSTPDYITLSNGVVLNISYFLQEKYTEPTYGLEVTVTKAYSPNNASCYFECLVYNPSYTGADVGADLMVMFEANGGMVGLVGGKIPTQYNYVIVSGSTTGPDTSILKGSSFTATAYNNS